MPAGCRAAPCQRPSCRRCASWQKRKDEHDGAPRSLLRRPGVRGCRARAAAARDGRGPPDDRCARTGTASCRRARRWMASVPSSLLAEATSLCPCVALAGGAYIAIAHLGMLLQAARGASRALKRPDQEASASARLFGPLPDRASAISHPPHAWMNQSKDGLGGSHRGGSPSRWTGTYHRGRLSSFKSYR